MITSELLGVSDPTLPCIVSFCFRCQAKPQESPCEKPDQQQNAKDHCELSSHRSVDGRKAQLWRVDSISLHRFLIVRVRFWPLDAKRPIAVIKNLLGLNAESSLSMLIT